MISPSATDYGSRKAPYENNLTQYYFDMHHLKQLNHIVQNSINLHWGRMTTQWKDSSLPKFGKEKNLIYQVGHKGASTLSH